VRTIYLLSRVFEERFEGPCVVLTVVHFSRDIFIVSEAMYKEYDQLKQQYELETGTLQKAMERASQVNN